MEENQKGLSAGRVQTVAVRLIVEREKEIEAFQPEEYWRIKGIFSASGEDFEAQFYGVNGKKKELSNEEEVKEILNTIKGKQFSINSVQKKKDAEILHRHLSHLHFSRKLQGN